ncbi:MAG: GTP 3',8-cyclase MoaA [Campylobacteraceae bacterium]|nr:GTP 3',8-cyclase MoaA [Campylobacteraceae bacterium]
MLVDAHGRKIDYLRVSVTERCNFRCVYCMNEKPFVWVPHNNILSYEEMFLFIKQVIDGGVNKIRITGGEPLVRPDIDCFIKMIRDYKADVDIALTTNGYLLGDLAQQLSVAGLKRVNVSLDSLKRDVVYKMSKMDALERVLEGIDQAQRYFMRVKINTVPLRGVNDDEILDIFDYAKRRNIMVRFIEYMENNFADKYIKGLSSHEIQRIISAKYTFKEIEKNHTSPAQLFELQDGYIFGIIAPHRHDFCESCNRIRLTAEGFLIPCLYFDEALSIKEALRVGDMKKTDEILREVLKNKPKENRWREEGENEVSSRAFYQSGG